MPKGGTNRVLGLVAIAAALGLMVAAAGCVSSQPQYAVKDPYEMVEIIEYEVTVVGYNTLGVEGYLRNICDDRLSAVGIAVKFYDYDGIMIGDGKTIVENLDPGETAMFTIRYYGNGVPDSAKIDEIRVVV